MDLSKPYFLGLMLYDFKVGLNAAESAFHINSAFGKDTVSKCTTQDWFVLIPTGDKDVENRLRSGRPFRLDNEQLGQIIKENQQRKSCQLVQALAVSQSTGVAPLREFGFVSNLSKRIPYQPTEALSHRHVKKAVSLLSFRLTKTWHSSVFNGNEK